MNKKRILKGIIFVSSLFLMTGCSVDYHMEIYNDVIREDIFVGEKDSTVLQDASKKQEIEENIVWTYDYWKAMDDSPYQLKKVFEPLKFGLEIKGKSKLQPMKSLVTVNNCYTHFNVIEMEEKYLISTSNKNLCFDYYENLDVVNIHISTNHKVSMYNADQVEKDTYTWTITRDNFENKSIQLEIFKDKYVWNYKNRVVKRGILAILILVLILTISVVSYKIYINRKRA